jgi:hypothetical protein
MGEDYLRDFDDCLNRFGWMCVCVCLCFLSLWEKRNVIMEIGGDVVARTQTGIHVRTTA